MKITINRQDNSMVYSEFLPTKTIEEYHELYERAMVQTAELLRQKYPQLTITYDGGLIAYINKKGVNSKELHNDVLAVFCAEMSKQITENIENVCMRLPLFAELLLNNKT